MSSKVVEFIVKVRDEASAALKNVAAGIGKIPGEISESFKMLSARLKDTSDMTGNQLRQLWGSVGRAIHQALSGNFSGAISSLSRLTPALAKCSVVAGALVVAFKAIKENVQNWIRERHERAMQDIADAISAIKEQAATASEEIKRLRGEIERLHQSRVAAMQNEERVASSMSDIDAATIRKNKAEALSGVTDPKERQRIEDEYQQKEFDLERRRIDEEAAAKDKRRREEIDHLKQEIAAAQKDLANASNEGRLLRQANGRLVSQHEDAMGAYSEWAQRHNRVGSVVDAVKTGGGMWGEQVQDKQKRVAEIEKQMTENQKDQDAAIKRQREAAARIKALQDKLREAQSGGTTSDDAEIEAKRAALEAREAEYRARRQTQDAREAEAKTEEERAEAEKRAAEAAKEREKKEAERAKEADRIRGEIKKAEIRKLQDIIRSADAAAREADAMEAQAKAALEEAQNRKLGMDDLDAKDAARKAAKEEAKKDRRYENMKDNIRRAWDNARRFNPGASDEELIKRMPRKWRDIIEQERKKQSDIKDAVDKDNEAKLLRKRAEEEKAAAEKKLEERWGIVDDIDKVLKDLKVKLQNVITVDESTGEAAK